MVSSSFEAYKKASLDHRTVSIFLRYRKSKRLSGSILSHLQQREDRRGAAVLSRVFVDIVARPRKRYAPLLPSEAGRRKRLKQIKVGSADKEISQVAGHHDEE